MKALTRPRSGFVFVESYGERGSSSNSSQRERGFVKWPPETSCFVRPQRVVGFGHLNLVSVEKRKPICPITCLPLNSQEDSETADVQIQERYESKTVHVKFQIQKECLFGEEFLIVGDDPMFGLWDPASAIPLNWSEGHVWSVELHIPVGKSIQFKFILKAKTGNLSWQPGPDRIFQTWETTNIITVCEDWENAESQKIMEEERIAIPSEGSSEMMIVDENLTQLEEQMTLNVNKELAISHSDANPAEKTLAEPHKAQIVADNIASSQENLKSIVADNISYAKQDPLMIANMEVLNNKRLTFMNENSTAISNDDMIITEGLLGNNGRGATVENQPTGVEGSLINYEGNPVLVPGLTISSAVPTEEANQDGVESRIAFDGSVGTFEAKDRNLPEAQANKILLDEKQEPLSDPPDQEEETTEEIFNSEEAKPVNELEKKPHLDEREEPSDLKTVDPIIFLEKDIQWGRKTLQNLLTKFGLL
ncbi:hypothetical protein FNV43_RR10475 [Rhamnella rubrinervis]|uniref:CBM20 domain-containing protein n=1 Tax=Rhamnella rubrinervis TaxID=2594499 RepID=A0A8K0HD95_9ROSA|nr:hypothetical protein FNV43_RR10475 [Rhamnella rubrinervis]